jgi:PHD/YefM family antitoxin component YafN of YafNO toxin-antitoxin module
MKIKTTLSITEARKEIFSITKEIQNEDNYFTLTERGFPKAVILSAEKFESLIDNENKKLMLADGDCNRYASQNKYSHVFAKTLIIRDESRVVYLSGNDQDLKNQKESLIKAQLYVNLIEKYKYPFFLVEFGRYVKVGSKEGKHYIEADVIVNDEKGNVKMIFETISFSDFEKNSDKVVSDLFELANALSWIKKPEYIICFSRDCGKNPINEKILAIDCRKFNSFLTWKKAGRPAGKEIPAFKNC